MSKNFGQLKSAIAQWLIVDSEDTAERLPSAICGDLINWTIKSYCRNRESRFGEDSDYFSTVALTRDYDEPSNFSKPKKFYYISPDSGKVVILDYLDKDKFDATYPGSALYATGAPALIAGVDSSLIIDDPSAYTLWDGKIILGKVPDRVLTIFRDFYAIPADLADDTDTNRMTLAADDYILFKSLAGAAIFGIEDERIPMWAGVAAKLEAEIDSEDSRRKQTGRIPQSREPG